MPDELFWRAYEDVDEGLGTLAAIALEVQAVFRESGERVRSGRGTLTDVVAERGARDRKRLEEAIRIAQARIRKTRVHLIRTMVEEEGMTLTAVAKLMGISRQAVSALYQEAINEAASTQPS
jgi:DNA-directed RNA polymerase specialized sigma subunit